MRRVFALIAAVFAVSLLLAPMAVGPAFAQSSNETVSPTPAASPTPTENGTATPTAAPQQTENGPRGGEYSVTELRKSGRAQGVDNLESVRALGSPPSGFAAVRYRDPTLIDDIMGGEGAWQQISSDRTVKENEIQLYGSAFGSVSGEYDLVIVFWEYDEYNGTAYAANQTVKRQTVSFNEDELYSYHNVTLPQHLDDTKQATMWLERGGEKADGVQWRFMHRSNPKSAGVSIDSQGDAWGFAFRTAVIPGVLSTIIGLAMAYGAIKIAGRGPGYGIASWLVLVGIVGSMVAVIAYYQIAVILNNIPYVMGLVVGVVAFGAGLTFHEPVKKIGFFRRELIDAETIPGGTNAIRAADGGVKKAQTISDAGAELFDEFTEATYVDLPSVPAVRTPDGYRVPVTGLRPFFARLFSNAALLDLESIATRVKVKKGGLDDLIYIDPREETPVKHKPARLVRVLPWDTLEDDAGPKDTLVAGVMSAAILLGPAAIGHFALGASMNIPWVGVVFGLGVTTVLAYSAEDGWIEFNAATPHFRKAEESLTILQRAYKVADEEASGKIEARKERATTSVEAREDKEDERKVVTDRVLESLGASAETGAVEPSDEVENSGEIRDVESDDDDDDDDDEESDGLVEL